MKTRRCDSAHLMDPPEETPAFVYSNRAITTAFERLRSALCGEARILYSTKACSVDAVIRTLEPLVDGFAVASTEEGRLVSAITNDSADLHITTPALQPHSFWDRIRWAYVAFNSLAQFERVRRFLPETASVGIRVNPGMSNVEDKRYDPCRRYSKLGVPLPVLREWLVNNDRAIEGLHIHNACLAESWDSLFDTVARVTSELAPTLKSIKWMNVGGGYVWGDKTNFAPLRSALRLLRSEYDLDVFIEPGAGFVNSAGFLIASVIDLMDSDGKTVAVLDTTVNHVPEVFEYQYEPDVAEHTDDGAYEYVLAGCTCLAGDLFGIYRFDSPLEIGSRITFENVGAYTIAKASRFNGIPLPRVYMSTDSGALELAGEIGFDGSPNGKEVGNLYANL